MKKVINYLFIPALLIASAFSCTNVREVEVEVGSAVTTISAYMDEASTKTGYVIDEQNHVARFNWLESDQIDVAVKMGDSYTPVRFLAKEAGFKASFKEAAGDGEPTLASLRAVNPAAELGDMAYYPSRGDAAAQDNGTWMEWEVLPSGNDIDAILTIPSVLNANMGNPLSTIPLLGWRDPEGEYCFKPATAVLAIPVKNITPEMDFISISHETAALSGSFSEHAGITQDAVLSGAGHSLKLVFSGLDGDCTFFFPVAAGEIPAGLNIRCGDSSDPDNQMSLTTKNAVVLNSGHIGRCGAITFAPEDQQWEDFITGSFLDDFIWAQRSWEASTWVPVSIQRSGRHPEKYRMPNPYAVASDTFGYTPATQDIASDEYFVFYIDGESVRFVNMDTGVEDSASRPLGVEYRPANAAYSRIVSSWADGTVTEVQFAGFYTIAGNFYTKDNFDGSPKIHLKLNHPEKWLEVAEGEFIDNLIWPLQGWGETRVPVKLLQSTVTPENFRIANPYLAAAQAFGYSTYTDGIEGAEYVEISMLENNALQFATFYAGIEDKPEGGKPMKIWYPTDWGGSYDTSYNKVVSWRADGLPAEMQFAVVYSDVNPSNYSYKYTKNTAPTIHFYFPEEAETWVSVGTMQYKDDFIVNNRMGKGINQYVNVTLEQSQEHPSRFRIANPYPALCELVGATSCKYFGNEDAYLVMTVNNDDTVTYEEFRAGIGDATKELAICQPEEFNSVTGGSKTTGNSSVTGYKNNGLPQEIRLYAIYHGIGDYSYIYSRDTDQYGDVIVIRWPDSWVSIGNGLFKDKLVWSCAGLNDYAQVEFQQDESAPSSYRIAKPYPGENSGEWFCFDISNPEKVTSDNYFVDVEVTAEGKATFKPWVRNGIDYGYNYSTVFKTKDNGDPAIVQIGPCYRGENFTATTEGYKYEIGRDHEQLAIEIVFPGCEPYDAAHPDAKVTDYQLPMVAGFHNPVASLELPTGTLQKLVFKITGVDPASITGLRLYQGGWMDADYVAPDANGIVTMDSFTSATVSSNIDLNLWYNGNIMGSVMKIEMTEAVVSGASCNIIHDEVLNHYPGVRVNHGGDEVTVRGSAETVSAFRIPALVTSNNGTLIAAYDVRYDHSGDLQADIDVGVKRSTDGGKTWGPLALAMDMGVYGYEEQIAAGTMTEKEAQQMNGIGDPCLLIDENTGELFCFAVWTHGHKGERSLSYAGTGYEIDDTPQYMMVRSTDDGVTWSEPVNITRQVKKYDWRMTFQGPGRGITMKDGTLVVPMQHQENGVLNSGIMYSKDHGLSWHAYEGYARHTTSECAVAEITPGTLMLTMRDETNSHYRAVYTTTDLGRTWTPHVSDKKVIEPTCEASLLHVDADKNSLGKDLLLFSNPASQSGRSHITIKASLDQGETWPYALTVDEGGGWGYSCLTMVDSGTVGILYESSKGHIVFQAVPLADIVK